MSKINVVNNINKFSNANHNLNMSKIYALVHPTSEFAADNRKFF